VFFTRLGDISREGLERWLASPSPKACRRERETPTVGLWCLSVTGAWKQTGSSSSCCQVAKANEKIDRRRQRRAMDESELVQLLEVARRRPLIEALTVRKGPRKGERYAMYARSARTARRLGRERALIYKTLVLTGLRKGELASLTMGQLDLDGAVPFAVLDAADEKNRQGSEIALRDDLAADLKNAWLSTRMRSERSYTPWRANPGAVAERYAGFQSSGRVAAYPQPRLRLAGIAKRDERGRVLDVHALRTTFATLLTRAVLRRDAQQAMRIPTCG